MKPTHVFVLSLFLSCGCAHRPPTTSGVERKRIPVNSAEQQARLAFCADLGLATSQREESPASAPVVPVVMELSPAPSTVPACAPPAKASSYVMRVSFPPKSALFKPSAEQVSELVPYLGEASRVEVRAPGSVAEEKLAFLRASAARDFLLKQGVPASRIWLQVAPPVPTASGEEAMVVGVEIEVKGGEQ